MSTGLRKVIFFTLLLGVTFLVNRYMLKPANSALAEAKGRVEQKTVKLEEFREATAATADINKQLEQLQGAIDFFESKLPPKNQIYKVLEQVTLIAQKQGLKPKTIRTLKRKDNSGYIEQPLKMELVGNFNSFYSFLLEIEKLDRIMKIRELKLRKQPNSDGQVTANFVISIFFLHS